MTAEPLDITNLAELRENFTESDLPFKVDILDWASISESFRKIIKEKCLVIQEKSVKNQVRRNKEEGSP